MATLDSIKNNLIDHILATDNEKLLTAIMDILDSSAGSDVVRFSSEQLEMIAMGEEDIANNRLVSEQEISIVSSECGASVAGRSARREP